MKIGKFLRLVVGSMLGVQVLFWVAVIGGGIYFASDVVALLEGALGRLDHLIGYAGGAP